VLKGHRIILGVTGGIAAYKAIELLRLLKKQGASVRVVMTEHAKAFVTALTFSALADDVASDVLGQSDGSPMAHIDWVRWADCVLVAPATAHFIAKLSHGLADDLLSTLCLARQCPLLVCPAMNQQMYQSPAVTRNLLRLAADGVTILGPAHGEQACGEVGPGRLLPPEEILARYVECLQNTTALQGKRVLITAGPTQEAIDPVRYLTNYSSGKMGYALAEQARMLGAEVTLVSGPVHLAPPLGVRVISVISAEEMLAAVLGRVADCDVFIATAAVADYRPDHCLKQKHKKKVAEPGFHLSLVKNPDILQQVAQHALRPSLVVGFAAETEQVIAHAKEKRQRKSVDVIIANDVSDGQVFGQDESAVHMVTADGVRSMTRQPKPQLARAIWQELIPWLVSSVV
jgi:phosphopantothenoylcysteine decarboxylase/phosphopantothenate--cysteine ligase